MFHFFISWNWFPSKIFNEDNYMLMYRSLNWHEMAFKWHKRKSIIFLSYNLLAKSISTSNHKFRRAIWDKLLKCIFENFEIAQVKKCYFKNLEHHEDDLYQTFPETNMWLLVNHTKRTSKHFALKLISFNNGQLQINGQATTK